MNQAQEEKYHSFPLFSFCSSIAGYLYPVRIKSVRSFSTTMTISGDAYSTGKSLFYEACMHALYGDLIQSVAPNSIPRLYEMLASGTAIYCK